MERKATFVAIENDGQKRTIENWKKADILLLLEALRIKNQDLYAFMQDCVTKGYRQMNLVGIQCEEPPPLRHYCTSEKKTPTFKSSLNDGQLEILVQMLNDMMVFAHPVALTKEVLGAFFRCEQTELKVRNLRLLCAIMQALSNYGHIGRYWQAPIYKHKLLWAYKKDGHVNRSDLTTANHAINNVLMDERVKTIIKTVKSL
ncbi:hypothetical protein [Prevotella sp.]|uniref:hypothetical protein n=1 Tax=Prevotella sp. TaxID=59823 RepID=UPI0027E380B1|nr:hypothetical protein [Prevotella sp.]